MIGIYRIKNLVNGKCYYGSSKEIEKRLKRHKGELNNNVHINCLLQRAWNKYGEKNFLFEVIEECDEIVLLEKEQYYLDLNPEYNIGLKSSGGDNLTKNPNKNIIVKKITESIKQRYSLMTDEEKKDKHSKPMEINPNWKGGISISNCEVCGKKISQGAKKCMEHIKYERNGSDNPFFGKQHSEDAKKIMSEKRKGKKPTNMTQVQIYDIVYESLAEASRQTGIPSPTILWRINSKNKKYENYQSHPSIKLPLSN